MDKPAPNDKRGSANAAPFDQDSQGTNQADDSFDPAEESRNQSKRLATLQAEFAHRGAQLIPGAAGFVVAVGGIARHLIDLDAAHALLESRGACT